MDYKSSFEQWLNHFSGSESETDSENKTVLSELKNIESDEKKVISAFSSDLKFGTAGLRGTMGIGSNKLNVYTIRRATQGLANFILSKYKSASVVISFDSRINSEIFAKETAKVLSANGIKAFITEKLAPTPFLSFAVRELSCKAGVMITASHNPSEYNGYKCYSEDGAQMSSDLTERVYEHIQKVDIFKDVKIADFNSELEKGKIEFVSEKIYQKYIQKILEQAINKEYPSKCEIRVTYTPLNGAGKTFVEKVLSESGVKNLNIVKEQAEPDGNFPTCKYPNPEINEVFDLAVKNAKENSSDVIIATDPDSDRLGLKVLHNGNYESLTGNQIGILLFNYLISQKKEKNALLKNPIAVRTLVSSHMIDAMAKNYNCDIWCVPTGFKNIGRKLFELEKSGSLNSFLFGFEESNGYLVGTYTRDKDAVSASLILCEMLSFYKEKQLTLVDVLKQLYKTYGFYLEKTVSLEFEQINADKKIASIMEGLKSSNLFHRIGTKKVVSIKDYKNSSVFNFDNNRKLPLDFPKLDIIEFILSDGSSIIVRPSGTEPKIKIYIMTVGEDEVSAKLSLDSLEKDICVKIKNFIK